MAKCFEGLRGVIKSAAVQQLVDFRRKDYEMLCDSLYAARGYDSNAVPLPKTVKRLELCDEQAKMVIERSLLKN